MSISYIPQRTGGSPGLSSSRPTPPPPPRHHHLTTPPAPHPNICPVNPLAAPTCHAADESKQHAAPKSQTARPSVP
eukprot:scaffold29537_cov56-Phaeocystis_antarctica.AAC.3